MARILKKVPNFKLPKYKMRDIDEIEELKVDYTDEFIKNLDKKGEKKAEGYPGTDYRTIKEIFVRNIEKYKDRPFVLEKFNRKGAFEKSRHRPYQDLQAERRKGDDNRRDNL
mgnify:CR=1 FL=1